MPRIKVQKVEGTRDEIIVTCEYKHVTNFLRRLVGLPEKVITKKYVGSCTVWHTFPEFRRCGTFKEGWLSEIWSEWRYKNRKNSTPENNSCNNVQQDRTAGNA